MIWIEELIEMAENSASSPVYPLLKREDEKYVTEHAFDNPMFVEDIVRNTASKLQVDDRKVLHFEAIINSMTPAERENPKLLNGSRRLRIAKGSGRPVFEVNQLLKQFAEMQRMMKGSQFRKLLSKMP